MSRFATKITKCVVGMVAAAIILRCMVDARSKHAVTSCNMTRPKLQCALCIESDKKE